jgi:MFS family permease
MSTIDITGRALPTIAVSRAAVGAAYAAQGLGYAVVVTALPTLKDRYGISDTVVSLIILLVCVAAAGGSVLADRLASVRGSRAAVVVGLVFEAAALLVIASPVPLPVFVGAFALYGVGLGMVDAAGAMQGVLVQQRVGTSVMSGFFACYTAAAIVGALVMSGLAGVGWSASIALSAAAVFGTVTLLVGRARLDPRLSGTSPTAGTTMPRTPLPHRGIAIFGMVIFAAFAVDSAVSTWSTVYLADVLLTSAAVAPLGYAAYQTAILVTRLGGDWLVRRHGRPVLAVVTALLTILGCALVALVPTAWAAVAGFTLAGFGVGALVPLAFSSAGELDVARSDAIVARVNLFNYAGAVLGSVLVGLLADGPGLALGFLVPLLLVVPVLAVVRSFRPGGGVGRSGASRP